jgi:hypothetical protein
VMLNETGDIRVVLKHKNGLAQLRYPRVPFMACQCPPDGAELSGHRAGSIPE